MRSAVVACLASVASCQSGVFNVMAYGAVGDGVTDDTTAVRETFAAAGVAGGGTVLFPSEKTFLTGAFNITSNTVVLVQGTILGSGNSSSYVLIPPLPWYGGGQDAQQSGAPEWQALVHSWYATNVTLTGGGVIDGGGAPWWKCKGGSAYPCNGYSRPQLMMLVHTVGVDMFSLTVKDSPSWTIHFANCTNVHVWDVHITAPSDSPNTDGFDIDCSVNVLVENSSYSGGDDAVAVKSGIDWLGRTFGRPTSNVTVRNLAVGTSHGISVGSEMSAGVRDVTFRNITMLGTGTGPHIKSQRGRGGVVEDITYDGINVTLAGTAFLFTLNYHSGLPPTNASATPIFRNIAVRNVVVNGAGTGWVLDGLSDSTISNVSLSDISMSGVVTLIGKDDYTSGTCVGVKPSCPPLLPALTAD